MDSAPSDGGVDSAPSDGGTEAGWPGVDAATEVSSGDGADASPVPECRYSDCTCVDFSRCTERPNLIPEMSLAMQDTGTGGFGDCADCASCSGGRNLYYSVRLPPMSLTRIRATPLDPRFSLLIRILSECSAEATTLESNRGGGITMGIAGLCLRNTETVARNLILAVGEYGGPAQTAVFNLSAETMDPNASCLAWPDFGL
ncbi:MAG: hypothetical protein H7X95_06250 [Deltaproteobacteria bacterium]|nr:hypothetical protein [Deltaproteobacteria bacterium]